MESIPVVRITYPMHCYNHPIFDCYNEVLQVPSHGGRTVYPPLTLRNALNHKEHTTQVTLATSLVVQNGSWLLSIEQIASLTFFEL